MQTLTTAIIEVAKTVRDPQFAGELQEDMVGRIKAALKDTFDAQELAVTEEFLSTLSQMDLAALACDDGESVSNLYEFLQTPVEVQMVVEEVMNTIYEEV